MRGKGGGEEREIVEDKVDEREGKKVEKREIVG